jgi:ubiquitin-like 1-activating enzyme E1 A
VIDVKEKKENGKNVEMVTKRELYSTWFLASDAAGLPAEFLKTKRRLKAVTPIISCLRALWEFTQLQDGRLPSTPEDWKMFTVLADQKHKALGLPSETLRSEVLRKFLQNVGSEIAPVTAVLGGQLAQDVINVLGARQQPIQNMVVFDGDAMEAPMYALHPEGALGEALLPLSLGAQPVMMNSILPDGVIPNGMNSFQPGMIQT